MNKLTKLFITTPLALVLSIYCFYFNLVILNIILLIVWFVWCLLPNKYFYIESNKYKNILGNSHKSQKAKG